MRVVVCIINYNYRYINLLSLENYNSITLISLCDEFFEEDVFNTIFILVVLYK